MPPNDDIRSAEVILSDHITMAEPKGEALNQDHVLVAAGNVADRVSQAPGSIMPTESLQKFVLEPRTGFRFPSFVDPNWSSSEGSICAPRTQVCVGVGIRGVNVLKLPVLKIYAFGLYINPENIKAKLGPKYAATPAGELRLRKDLYEDLLRYELEMSVRLIVHHKHVRMGMVRSAFETSLKNRLKKIKGTDNDEGLITFCSYLTEDLSLPAGTVIDFQWQPGGLFHTKVGERFMGTIFSLDFCRAFFDLYLGDPPVCSKAKQDIGLKLGQLLHGM